MKINEIFHSIQGEGLTMGIPTTFVRLAGCNLRCQWCDTKYAYDEGEEMGIDEILARVEELGCDQVCVTGGEPLHQEGHVRLIEKLLESGHLVTLETNGSFSLEELPVSDHFMISMDLKCPSSKMDDQMRLENLELLSPNDQLKFVICDEEDYEHAKNILAQNESHCNVIMQPVDGRDLKQLAKLVVRDNLAVRVLPQLHKLIWGDKRGV